jgi:Secretion system C-terminal sorting domain
MKIIILFILLNWSFCTSSIAEQCPYLGGNAVFAARAMLAAHDNTYYNDRTLCLQQGIMWRVQKPKDKPLNTIDQSIKVYPNPTNTATTVSFSALHPACTITIIDLLGRNIGDFAVEENATNTVIPFSNTPTGIYLLTIRQTSSGEAVHQQKINVIH